MKIALDCHSVLIEKSLRKFLANQLVGKHEADIVVSDYDLTCEKPVLRIGMDDDADLRKPFSRSQLMIKLEEKMKENMHQDMVDSLIVEEKESLDEKIERATRHFVDELIDIIKAHYEKRE